MSQPLTTPLSAPPAPSGRAPITDSDPDRLETIARLRAMQPVAAPAARILEFGCGAGENLLPLADRYPHAQLLGIDTWAPSITTAEELAREAGLANVEFRQQKTFDLAAEPATFDYILVHDLYSRLDVSTRGQLLAVCRDHLSPHGIVYVSYETYPGALPQDMLREMMCYEARRAANRAEAIGQARRLLDFLRSALTQDHPYDAVVSARAAELAALDDHVLWDRHLSTASAAIYFPQFVEAAEKHALQLVGDATVGILSTDYLWPAAERQLESVTPDPIVREMLRDVVQNRAERGALLCHADVALSGALAPEVLRGMYLEGALRPEEADVDLLSDDRVHFSQAGTRTSTTWPLVKAALVHLGEAWPDQVKFDTLVTAARARYDKVTPAASTTEDAARLEENLVHCCVGGSLRLHSHPASFVRHASDMPLASPLARAQARRGGLVANRRHEGVQLDPFDRQLLAHLDGTLNRQQLIERLATAVREGKLVAAAHDRPLESYDAAKEAFTQALPAALARLANSALLIA